MFFLTNIDNRYHIFIQIISDHYKNMNLYILVLLSLLLNIINLNMFLL